MNFNILTVKGRPPSQHWFPCMLSNLPDDGQKRRKNVVYNNWMYSILKHVFALTINTDININLLFYFPITFHMARWGTRCVRHVLAPSLWPLGIIILNSVWDPRLHCAYVDSKECLNFWSYFYGVPHRIHDFYVSREHNMTRSNNDLGDPEVCTTRI
jgi:hypothetical protein